MREHLVPGSRLYRLAPRPLRRAFVKWSVPPGIRRSFPIPNSVEREIADVNECLNTLPGGWCPVAKQHVLAHLVVANACQRAVEIGVFQGGSLFPMAAAMRITGGLVIGIDPYSSEAAEERDNREAVESLIGANWHRSIHWDELHSNVAQELGRRNLNSHARLVRMRSSDAAHEIQPGIDLLHIDGNHDFAAVADDLLAYLPKVRPGGFLVLDDTNWDTVWRHADALAQRLPIWYQAVQQPGSRPSWIVFRQVQLS
jgi:predicted O-methyltransferase YrrM